MSAVTDSTRANENRILVVDDEEPIRRILCRLLERNGYPSAGARDAEDAMVHLKEDDYSLVLTDMDMPGSSGLDLIMQINQSHPDTATVMVTGMDDAKLAHTALDIGAYGYIIKPFEPNEILINVANALRRRGLEIENRNHRLRLEQMIKERTAELWEAIARLEKAEKDVRLSREETIQRLVIAAEFRDDETAQHIQRMSRYCGLLARSHGADLERAELIRVASLMHDVGKIGIPDSILLKPGKLTPEERTIMQQHSEIGYRILAGSKSELLRTAADIAWTHHERVDGTGYPLGLVGDQIPLEGRIAAIADVFDALTSDRVYKKAFPLGKAVDIMREGRNLHFDPALLDSFLNVIDEALEIRERYADR
ncbi:MAG TPA: HD domain-containing phosphohydrolase [Actinomycetota bacterium]|nr:HD domain-containing phosphohydrolase [Actinomycetota bacterium]